MGNIVEGAWRNWSHHVNHRIDKVNKESRIIVHLTNIKDSELLNVFEEMQFM